jgi:hypothetical protein
VGGNVPRQWQADKTKYNYTESDGATIHFSYSFQNIVKL